MAGAAGGRRDPTRIRIDDLARTTGDSLLSRVRQQLRKHHGFPREAQGRFRISAVFSDEQMAQPNGLCQTSGGLSCSGYGSSVAVTAGFGFAMAAKVLDHIAFGSLKSSTPG
jgi:tRNA A37 threonylcarbamoyladenosine dehydratase